MFWPKASRLFYIGWLTKAYRNVIQKNVYLSYIRNYTSTFLCSSFAFPPALSVLSVNFYLVQICGSKMKPLYLVALLQNLEGEKCIVFTSSVEATHRLCTLLNFFADLKIKIKEYSGLQRQSIRRYMSRYISLYFYHLC